MASDWFDRITVALGVLMLNGMLIVGLLQVLGRYVSIPIGITWTYEVAQTLLALMTILAIPYMFKNEGDISFVPVLKRVTTRTNELLLIRNVLMAFLAVVFVVSAHRATTVSGDTTLALVDWFKIAWAYSFFGVSAAVLLIAIAFNTRQRIVAIRGDSSA